MTKKNSHINTQTGEIRPKFYVGQTVKFSLGNEDVKMKVNNIMLSESGLFACDYGMYFYECVYFVGRELNSIILSEENIFSDK